MTDHADIRAALNTLAAALVKSERRLHLAQPVRSTHLYREVLDQLTALAGLPATDRADRYQLADIRSRLLWMSKHSTIDRDQLLELAHRLERDVRQAIAQADATRPR